MGEALRRADLTDLLLAWVRTRTWEESRSFLDEHARELLTDEVEALLHDLVAQQPYSSELLTHAGLPGLCREDGIDGG